MKKVALILAVVMIALIAFSSTAMAETKIGQTLYAAHGTKCFTVATVAMDGVTIVDAMIDEFQYVNKESFVGVPNSDNADGFGGYVADATYVLGSKRVNDEAYSENMATKGGATQKLSANWEAVQNFVIGKTVADLEAAVASYTGDTASADFLAADVVSGSTLADTLGYVNALIEAAKSVK